MAISGLILLFWSDLEAQQWTLENLKRIGDLLLGTWLFSFGNRVGVRHTRCGLHAYTSTTWAMAYGCLILLTLMAMLAMAGAPPVTAGQWWDSSPRYLAALLYLSLFASVLGFTAYLMLVARIGANSAAYTLIATPVIALSLSSLFEGYQWTLTSIIGLLVIIAGNLTALNGNNPTRLARLTGYRRPKDYQVFIAGAGAADGRR